MFKYLKHLIALLILTVLVLTVAAPGAQTAPVAAQDDPVTITWFVGLGSGGQPEQIEVQEAVVEEFNNTHDDIQLELIISDFDVASDTLSTLIASGDAPDIIGPVGIGGSNAFAGSFLDLAPYVEQFDFDLSNFDPALVDFYQEDGEGLTGLPFAVYPSYIYYNRDLFDEAGLDYPPQEFGATYGDLEWDVDTLRQLAMFLTIDENGNDATSDDFDPEAISQFGFSPQWYADDLRSLVTSPFGAGAVYEENEDGSYTAVMPDHWREGIDWYYQAMWEDYFMPDYNYQQSDMLNASNLFASGNIAMVLSHLWYTCCIGEDVTNWDIAVVPSYNGEYNTKLHADTFRIMSATENPDEAFQVLAYLLTDAAPQLLEVYGAFPADATLQQGYIDSLNETFTQGVNWQVAIDSLAYPDNPNHESWMPNFNEADRRVKEFQQLIQTTPGLDLDAEIETLLSDLQVIFDEAAAEEAEEE